MNKSKEFLGLVQSKE